MGAVRTVLWILAKLTDLLVNDHSTKRGLSLLLLASGTASSSHSLSGSHTEALPLVDAIDSRLFIEMIKPNM